MNKVFIECEELIKSYKINKEDIIKQLEAIKIGKDQDFIIAFDKDFRFTLVGKVKSIKLCKKGLSHPHPSG